MKFRFILLSVFLFSCIANSFSREVGAGGYGGIGIMQKMAFFSPPSIEVVHIVDVKTGSEIGFVLYDDLEYATECLSTGEYLFIYTDSEGNVVDEASFLKE